MMLEERYTKIAKLLETIKDWNTVGEALQLTLEYLATLATKNEFETVIEEVVELLNIYEGETE
jgi:hypothetical protein